MCIYKTSPWEVLQPSCGHPVSGKRRTQNALLRCEGPGEIQQARTAPAARLASGLG